MSLTNPSFKIRAQFLSIGGGILLAVVLLIATLTAEVFISPGANLFERVLLIVLFLLAVAYSLDSWSEVLGLDGTTLFCDSWFKPRQSAELLVAQNILLVHEGLNSAIGIISIKFRYANKEERILSLGPLWHRHHLEQFLKKVEQRTGKRTVVEQVQ